MPPTLRALADFGHLAGVVLVLGSLLWVATGAVPAGRARAVIVTGIALILATGLIKWTPWTGGVGWLGHRRLRTAFLHGKLVLAVVVFTLAWRVTKGRAGTRAAAVAVGLGALVMLLAVLHKTGV